MPNVDSALLVMENINKHKDILNIELFKKFVKDSFNQKRKSIKNNLKNYNLVKIEEVLKENNKDLSIRAEDIDVDLFIKMANRIG
jgi:16S rRNA A1518/A1519 N6-dimethyltransferase RsmA/KsgA/DIM1 with predicted DNA glycosylase/AP lyase activity